MAATYMTTSAAPHMTTAAMTPTTVRGESKRGR
jgi:hypothetical protein